MINVVEVSKRFSARTVFSGVSLVVNPGEIIGVLGANGVGKTTLMRLIAGLEEPDKGTIWWRDEVWAGQGSSLPSWRRPIGTMFQQPTLWPHLNVRKHLDFVLSSTRLSRGSRTDRVSHWLQRLDLESLRKRFPAELSGGQQSRVALARALVREPELLLLDEPFAPMDSKYQAEGWAVIKEYIHSHRACALLITQDGEWARSHLDRIFTLGSQSG